MKPGRRRPDCAATPTTVVLLPAHVHSLLRAYRRESVVVPREGPANSRRHVIRQEIDSEHLLRYGLLAGDAEPYTLTERGCYWLARGLRPLIFAMAAEPPERRSWHKVSAWGITIDEEAALNVGADNLCRPCGGRGSCSTCKGWGRQAQPEAPCHDCGGSALCPHCNGEGAV